MRVFVLRARRAPVSGARFLASVGKEAHVEVIAHTLINGIFLSRGHYADVRIYLVLEQSADFSRTIVVDTALLASLGGFHEAAMLELVAGALDAAGALGKEERIDVAPGIGVQAISFEHLARDLAQDHPLYVLDRRGSDIRETALDPEPCFLLSDHVKMPKKSLTTLTRLGARKISLGPRMLFASQCVVLLHNELDRRSL